MPAYFFDKLVGLVGDEFDMEFKSMKDLYQKIRSEILDKGNNQARNIDAELAQYDVEWLRYSVKMPVITKKED